MKGTNVNIPLNRRSNKGFTLMEALFAISIALLGFTALFNLQNNQLSSSAYARDLSGAVHLAQRVIAELRRESFTWVNVQRESTHLTVADSNWRAYTPVPVNQNNQPVGKAGKVIENGIAIAVNEVRAPAGPNLTRQLNRSC